MNIFFHEKSNAIWYISFCVYAATLLFLIICVLACSFSSCRSVQLRDKHKTEKSDVVSKTEVQP